MTYLVGSKADPVTLLARETTRFDYVFFYDDSPEVIWDPNSMFCLSLAGIPLSPRDSIYLRKPQSPSPSYDKLLLCRQVVIGNSDLRSDSQNNKSLQFSLYRDLFDLLPLDVRAFSLVQFVFVDFRFVLASQTHGDASVTLEVPREILARALTVARRYGLPFSTLKLALKDNNWYFSEISAEPDWNLLPDLGKAKILEQVFSYLKQESETDALKPENVLIAFQSPQDRSVSV